MLTVISGSRPPCASPCALLDEPDRSSGSSWTRGRDPDRSSDVESVRWRLSPRLAAIVRLVGGSVT